MGLSRKVYDKYVTFQHVFAGDIREYELLMATDDNVLSNQLFLLHEKYTNSYRRYVGPCHEQVKVEKSGNKRERLGVVWLQPYNNSVAGFINSRWFLQAGQYLEEPDRKGEACILLGIGGYLNL